VDEPEMPPPPTIPPPPTRRQQRPSRAPERGYDEPAGDDIVIDDPSAMPRGGVARPGRPDRAGEYDFLPEDPRQRPPRRPRPQEPWDEEDEFFEDEPLPPNR